MLDMNWSPGANHEIAQETDAQGDGGGRMCEAIKSLAPETPL
jgi:hypothetical protein